jgi:hypothetical protein
MRKLVIGGEINRYSITPISGKQIIYTTPDTCIENYPKILAALLPYRERLMRREDTAAGRIPWFSLSRPRRKKLFDNPKILIRQTSDRIRAGLDTENWYCLKSAIIVQLPENSGMQHEFLMGLLNSRLMDYLYNDLVGEQARIFPEVKPVQLFKLPIRSINFSDKADRARHDRMVNLVEQMLAAKRQLQASRSDRDRNFYENKCAALDRQIDALVYELYELTPEEIALVEAN